MGTLTHTECKKSLFSIHSLTYIVHDNHWQEYHGNANKYQIKTKPTNVDLRLSKEWVRLLKVAHKGLLWEYRKCIFLQQRHACFKIYWMWVCQKEYKSTHTR